MTLENKKRKAAGLIQESLMNITRAIGDIDELDGLLQHSQYRYLKPALDHLKQAQGEIIPMMDRINELDQLETLGYAVWYYDGLNSYPAGGRFHLKPYYHSASEAMMVAAQLKIHNPGIDVMVYPVNRNLDVSGKAIR